MTGLRGVQVGDEVYISLFGQKLVPGTVQKIGRKWVTVSGYQFSIEDGSYNSGYSGHALTKAQYAELQERSDLVEELKDFGFGIHFGGRVTFDQIRAVVETLRELAKS